MVKVCGHTLFKMEVFVKLLMVVTFTGTVIGVECGTQTKGPIIKTVWSGGVHSEGPHWDAGEQALYWVDIQAQNVHRLEPETNNITSRHIGYGPVTPVVTVAGAPGIVALGVRAELYLLAWAAPAGDSALRLVTALDLGLPDNRLNDGKVDAEGRLWVGTMGKEEHGNVDLDQGALYMVTDGNYLEPPVKVRPVSVSNGIAWTRDNKFMFYIDTPTRQVEVFDFDLERGRISNRRSIFSFEANSVTGLPDGMTIDTDDNLWVACYNGGKVIKIDSRSGRLLEQHAMPADKVTSVSWGGRDLSTLYVTTSRMDLSSAELAQQPDAGSVFAVEGTGCRGWPANQFKFRQADVY